MKKILFLAVILTASMSASAQFANTGGTKTSTTANVSHLADSYGRFGVSYAPMELEEDKESEDLKGFSLEYFSGKSLSSDMPLFYEFGLRASYAWSKDKDDDYKSEFSFLTCSVPLNITYKFQLPGSNFMIAPYAGAFLRANLTANLKASYKNESESFSYFDDDDMDDAVWKRISYGWQFGLNVEVGEYVIGISKAQDMSDIGDDWEDCRFSQTFISVAKSF